MFRWMFSRKSVPSRNLGNAYKISLYRKSSFGNRCVSPAFSDAISSMYFTGNIFSHYCQALGSLGLTNSAKEFAHYAYYNALLMEDIYNASGLKNDLKKNYNISLL